MVDYWPLFGLVTGVPLLVDPLEFEELFGE